MILIKSKRFKEELQTIVLFIALDNPDRALTFFDTIIRSEASEVFCLPPSQW